MEVIVPPSVCESCIMSFMSERRLVIPVERKGDTSDQYTNDLIYTVCETKSTSKLRVPEMLHQIQVIFRLFRTR